MFSNTLFQKDSTYPWVYFFRPIRRGNVNFLRCFFPNCGNPARSRSRINPGSGYQGNWLRYDHLTWNSLDNSPPLRLRLQVSPPRGDDALDFGLEQEGLRGDPIALHGRLERLLGESDAIFSDFLAAGLDCVPRDSWLRSGVNLCSFSQLFGCLVLGSSQGGGEPGKYFRFPKNWQGLDTRTL